MDSIDDSGLTHPCDVLTAEATPVPMWLMNCTVDSPFPRASFFASRIVYYPGSSADGHPLRIFGKAHAAHCFVFSDNGQSAEYFESQLNDENHPGHPLGYRVILVRRLTQEELCPDGWSPHVDVAGMRNNSFFDTQPPGGAFAIWAVLERLDSLGDAHGPKRLAILVVGGEGVATYDALFCQDDSHSPYAILLQDHGFGGNWTRFGGDESPLRTLALRSGLPRWLFVANQTELWSGYQLASSEDRGGMHSNRRSLYRIAES